MHTLDSITFDAGIFTLHGDEDGVQIWHTAAGDGIVLPLRDLSYVIKVQCEERGITGIRDSEVLYELLGRGEVAIDTGKKGGQIIGWSQDPYDASIVSTFARNRAEAEEYDARFPEHPLSRLRLTLKHIQDTLRVKDEIKHEPKFVYQATQHHRPWWKIW
jgi:hypothetical protein